MLGCPELPLRHTWSHQGRHLCSACPGAQLLGPQQAGSNCPGVLDDSSCSVLEHLLPLWERWAPVEEGTDGGRETVPGHLPEQGQQASAAHTRGPLVQLLEPKPQYSGHCCLSILDSLPPR